jgi:hypothetical protein
VYVVDTNVVSASARSKTAGPLVTWMDEHPADLYVSAVSIAEIEARIARLGRQGARRKAGDLAVWLDVLLHLYEERILPFDLPWRGSPARFPTSCAARARYPALPTWRSRQRRNVLASRS